MGECLQYIDSLMPDEPYSTNYNAHGEIMTLEAAQQQKLPQAVIEEQLQALKATERKLAESEEEKQGFKAALEKEKVEKEQLAQKLRGAGIEP